MRLGVRLVSLTTAGLKGLAMADTPFLRACPNLTFLDLSDVSHTLSAAQTKYGAPDRELLAGVTAMRYFEGYLQNSHTFGSTPRASRISKRSRGTPHLWSARTSCVGSPLQLHSASDRRRTTTPTA